MASPPDVNGDVRRLPSGGAVTVSGRPGGDPILFLHGVGGGAWSWRPQIAALAPSFRVFAWDARGHGAAARVADAGLSDYLVDAREALGHATRETGRRAIVAGHSMGGLLAFSLAASDATRAQVQALFLVDPVYAGSSDEGLGHFSPRTGRIARTLCSPLLASFARNGRASRIIARWMFEHAFEDRAQMDRAWLDQRQQVPVEYARMLGESFTGPTGWERPDARDVAVPVMVLEGRSSRSGPRFPALVATLQERLGADFNYASLAGGHYLQLDRPDAVIAEFRRWAAARSARGDRAPV